MLGKERDGGYAQKIVVPAENAIPIPDDVSFDAAAIMMCSTATAYHALRLATSSPASPSPSSASEASASPPRNSPARSA